jgi:RHS repeat-associated protein
MPSSQQILLCHYRYDPLDRLISHTKPDTPAHQRFYCKSRLATEIQGVVRYSIIQHEDVLRAQQRRQGDSPEATLLATDLQRSVLDTIKANKQREAIAYSPYGHRPAESDLLSLLGFNGERPNPVTGHYLLGNGYRAFSPVLMRFICSDSWSPFGKGGLNAYAYCSGDPINSNDPTGHARMLFFFQRTSQAAHIVPHRTVQAELSEFLKSQNFPGPSGRVPIKKVDLLIAQPNQAPPTAQLPAYSRWDPISSVKGVNNEGLPVFREPPPAYNERLTPTRRPSWPPRAHSYRARPPPNKPRTNPTNYCVNTGQRSCIK